VNVQKDKTGREEDRGGGLNRREGLFCFDRGGMCFIIKPPWKPKKVLIVSGGFERG
jgi:hypothetical protein